MKRLTPILLRALRYISEVPKTRRGAHAIYFGEMGAALWSGNVQHGTHARQGLGMNAAHAVNRLEGRGLVVMDPLEKDESSAWYYHVTPKGEAALSDPSVSGILAADWRKRRRQAKACLAREGMFWNQWKNALDALDREGEKYGYAKED